MREVAEDPVLSGLWSYWRGKLAGRTMPRRADIDPADITRLLPYIQLVERVAGRYRYRLTGTAIVAAYGRELTGKFVDEVIPPGRRAVAKHHYDLAYGERRPMFVRNKYTTTKAIDIVASRLILPLSENGADVSMLLIAQTFEYGAQITERLDQDATLAPYFGRTEFL